MRKLISSVFLYILLTLTNNCISMDTDYMLWVETSLHAPPAKDCDSDFDVLSGIFADATRLDKDARQKIVAALENEIRANPQNARAYFWLSLHKPAQEKELLRKAAELNNAYQPFIDRYLKVKTKTETAAYEIYQMHVAMGVSDYPEHRGNFDVVRTHLNSKILKEIDAVDPWGHPYQYYCDSKTESYWIISYGSDSKPNKELYDSNGKPRQMTPSSTVNEAEDIVFFDDHFVLYPQDASEWVFKPVEFNTSDPLLTGARRASQRFQFDRATAHYEEYRKRNPSKGTTISTELIKAYFNWGVQMLKRGNCRSARDILTMGRLVEAQTKSKESAELERVQRLAIVCEKTGVDSVRKDIAALTILP
jgi:hypothetical protein